MPIDPPELEPVAIALDDVQVSDSVRLSGIDLDTGLRASVLIERNVKDRPLIAHSRHSATGLVLTLSIQKITDQG
jgi:hypothetical protein